MSTVRAISTGLLLRGKSQGLGEGSFVVWHSRNHCVKASYRAKSTQRLGIVDFM